MSVDNLPVGYRFKDLQAAGIVSSRGDLHKKQTEHGFPRPVKLSARAAWWPSDEVVEWLKARAALRNAAAEAKPSKLSPGHKTTRRGPRQAAATVTA
jgi:predicted DNA-binding transcriptional regulator AlpA